MRSAIWALPIVLLAACEQEGSPRTAFDVLAPGAPKFKAPSSLPPDDYVGDMWIDSAGCSFIATGPASSRRWVPQLSDARVQMCDPVLAPEIDPNIPLAQPAIAGGTFIDPSTGLKTEVIAPTPIDATYVLVGTFAAGDEALAVRDRFRALGYPTSNRTEPPRNGIVPVVLGPFDVESAVDDALKMAAELGFPGAVATQQN